MCRVFAGRNASATTPIYTQQEAEPVAPKVDAAAIRKNVATLAQTKGDADTALDTSRNSGTQNTHELARANIPESQADCTSISRLSASPDTFLITANTTAAKDDSFAPPSPAEREAPAEEPKEQAFYLKQLDASKPETLQQIPKEYLADPHFAREAVRKVPRLLTMTSDTLRNDKDFLRSVLLEPREDLSPEPHHAVLEHVKIEHREDAAFMKSLIDNGFAAYNEAGERLRGNREFLEYAALRHPIQLRKVPESLRHDREVLTHLFTKGNVLMGLFEDVQELLPRDIVHDDLFWLESMRENSQIFTNLPSFFRCDREFAKMAIINGGDSIYKLLPESLQQDRALAETAYRKNTDDLRRLHSSLLEDKNFLVKLLHHEGKGFEFLPKHLQRDPALIVTAAETNAAILYEVDKDVLESNPELVKELARRSHTTQGPLRSIFGEGINPEVVQIYANTEKALKILGFSEHTYNPKEEPQAFGSPQHGRFDATYEVIRNRWEVATPEVRADLNKLLGDQYFAGLSDRKDKRPRVAIIYAHSDSNGAFNQRVGLVSEDIIDSSTRHNKVLYYEVGCQDELIAAQNEIRKKGAVDHLIVGAHGSPTSMDFGKSDLRESTIKAGDKRFLTSHDGDRPVFDRLSGLVKDGGSVLLISCNTGEVATGSRNIAKAFHEALPRSTIYAPTGSVGTVVVVDRITGEIKAPHYKSGFRTVKPLVLPPEEVK